MIGSHPAGLYLLFFVEMWERFSYYGMKALLILYLVNAQHWSVVRAASLYGNYTALAYITPMVGGYLADRYLGARRCLVLGAVIIATGHFLLIIQGSLWFYAGLGFVVCGVGLFKPNVSTIVGQLYAIDDKRRDSGFTIFYMGISLGSLLAPLFCGYLAQAFGWHYGFAAAGVGMVLGLLTYLWGQHRYLPLYIIPRNRPGHDQLVPKTSVGERRHLLAILLVIAITIPFWTCYEQFGSSLSLFADRHIARQFGRFVIPASWFQSVNPIFLLLFAPLVAMLWGHLRRQQREPSEPKKMIAGFLLIAAGFVAASVAGARSETILLVSPLFFVAADAGRSLGELFVSPVGLAYITKVAPVRYGSRLMAAWFLAEGIGNKLSGWLAGYSDSIRAGRFYLIFVAVPIASALLLFLALPLLKRLGIKVTES